MIMKRENEGPQPGSVEHIFEILNDVKANGLPVSDAVDSLAYWYNEAFEHGDIQVEQPDGQAEMVDGGDMWT
ncbi:MAG TPA: hypothetical protein VFV52_08925 [Bacilli bacterium]|nr:hypothetical protein [Bacilli bacterium]